MMKIEDILVLILAVIVLLFVIYQMIFGGAKTSAKNVPPLRDPNSGLGSTEIYDPLPTDDHGKP